ncbi:MAG TPA: ABC transporter ATP-binding protein, partial [bacterium]|nr:ABC transporter ATP-binding protein [bacterium]
GVGKQDRRERAASALESMGMAEFSSRQAGRLSGGMKQKLMLASVLMHAPQVLLLDEPTTGVDPVSRREFWEILGTLNQEGVTILVTTPYMDEAARCDRVAFIHKGRLLTVERPEAIPGLYTKKLFEVVTPDNLVAARLLRASGAFTRVQVFGDRIHLSASGDDETLQHQVTALLEAAGIRADSVAPIAAGIEDVFVELLK